MSDQRILVTMDGDELVEDRCLDWELGNPSADDVRGAILRLDQTRFTCVNLSAPSGAQLTVAGGADRYICFYAEDVASDATSYWSLVAGSGATSETVSLSIGGQLGDLVLGSIKRDIGIKDMAATLPGHGGVLDRVNSLLLVAPAAGHYLSYFGGLQYDRMPRIITGAAGMFGQ